MDKEMQVFRSREFGDIRVLDIAGEPWFVGKDVAGSWGIATQERRWETM